MWTSGWPTSASGPTGNLREPGASSDWLFGTAATSPQEMADYTEQVSMDQLYRRPKDKDKERVPETALLTAPRTWEADERNAIPQVLMSKL